MAPKRRMSKRNPSGFQGTTKVSQKTLDSHLVRQLKKTKGIESTSDKSSSSGSDSEDQSSQSSLSDLSNNNCSQSNIMEKTDSVNTDLITDMDLESNTISQAQPAKNLPNTKHNHLSDLQKTVGTDKHDKPGNNLTPLQDAPSPLHTALSTLNIKPVNSASRNRRVCARILNHNRDTTPERNNRRPIRHTYKTRITVKLTLIDSGDMHQSINEAIKSLLKELKKSDSTTTILPWRENDHNKELIKPEEVPRQIHTMRQYVNKLYVPNEGLNRVIYPHLYIGHDKSLEDLKSDLKDWLHITNCGIYYKMLQVEDGTEVGWLLYSTREMDAGALADEIEDVLGFPVGLKWKVIDTGIRGKMPEKQKVQALTVEVDSKHQWKYQRTLAQFFSRTLKDSLEYPNGIRLRFVKRRVDAINMVERSKIDALRQRQQNFLTQINVYPSYDIIQLDYSRKSGTEPTLRQMIMNIKQKDSDSPLFHSIDLDWRGEAFNFQFCKTVKDEAECTINTLLPYLKHHYPHADVESYFTEEFAFRCEGLIYDSATQMVQDSLIDNLEVEGTDCLPGFNTFDAKEPVKDSCTERTTKTFMPTDNDSVSTIGPRFPNSTQSGNSSRSPPTQESITHTTGETSLSSLSESLPTPPDFSAQILGLKNQFEQQQQQMDEKFQTILHFLQSNTNKPTSVSQESHPSTDEQDPGAKPSSGARLS